MADYSYFCEHIGQAHLFSERAGQKNDAVGVYVGPEASRGKILRAMSTNGNGNGVWFDHCKHVSASNLRVEGNGRQCASNGSQGTGVVFDDCRNTHVNGYVVNPENTNAGTDVLINGSASTGSLRNAALNSAAGQAPVGFRCSDVTIPTGATIPVLTSASTMPLPVYGNMFYVSGNATIDSIPASWVEREVTLVFQGSALMGDAGNMKLEGQFNVSPGLTLTLKCDGFNWRETGRKNNGA